VPLLAVKRLHKQAERGVEKLRVQIESEDGDGSDCEQDYQDDRIEVRLPSSLLMRALLGLLFCVAPIEPTRKPGYVSGRWLCYRSHVMGCVSRRSFLGLKL
jgi:hypothetical protein